MAQKFCTVCGARLNEGVKFCENCGLPIELAQASRDPEVRDEQGTASAPTPADQGALSSPPKRAVPVKVLGAVILLIVIAAAGVVLVPKLAGGNIIPPVVGATPVPTPIPTPATPLTTPPATVIPTPTPDPFPDALSLKELFAFNEGKYASRATVYRYWMNATYDWHNDLDNRYYTQRPAAGNKYLFVFVNIENLGSDGYPYPKSSTIVVHYGGKLYHVDTSHYLPDKATNRKATPVEIREVEKMPDFFNLENAEDYGYSHGTTQDFVYPGQGNAIDGYLIYEVPALLAAEETYVEIVFDGNDHAVWKLR